MNIRPTAFAAALIACVTPAWAATSNVDVYGVLNVNVPPAYATYSAAADIGTNFFDSNSTYTPLVDVTSISGATAQINGAGYTASASTTLGSNHAYASVSSTPDNVLGAGSFSGWYDQVTITGGGGTGTLHFTVQLSGMVDVGQYGGSAAYGLYASSLHPTQLVDPLNIIDATAPATDPWGLNAPLGYNNTTELTAISTYLVGASPYNDTSILFPDMVYPTSPETGGIPIIPAPGDSLLGDAGMAFPAPDLILTPGAGQNIDITLHGTLTFTYGEAFYLIGGLGVSLFGDGLDSFCTFTIDGTCTAPAKDGTGATTLDFSNSANLVSIGLPEGATASFASGAAYNVTAVPEPAEWAMLLAGLALVGWRTRRKPA